MTEWMSVVHWILNSVLNFKFAFNVVFKKKEVEEVGPFCFYSDSHLVVALHHVILRFQNRLFTDIRDVTVFFSNLNAIGSNLYCQEMTWRAQCYPH